MKKKFCFCFLKFKAIPKEKECFVVFNSFLITSECARKKARQVKERKKKRTEERSESKEKKRRKKEKQEFIP